MYPMISNVVAITPTAVPQMNAGVTSAAPTTGATAEQELTSANEFMHTLGAQFNELLAQLGIETEIDLEQLASLDAQSLIAEMQALVQQMPTVTPLTPNITVATGAITTPPTNAAVDDTATLAALRLYLQAGIQTPTGQRASVPINPSLDAIDVNASTNGATIDAAALDELTRIAQHWLDRAAAMNSANTIQSTDPAISTDAIIEQAAASWRSLTRNGELTAPATNTTDPAISTDAIIEQAAASWRSLTRNGELTPPATNATDPAISTDAIIEQAAASWRSLTRSGELTPPATNTTDPAISTDAIIEQAAASWRSLTRNGELTPPATNATDPAISTDAIIEQAAASWRSLTRSGELTPPTDAAALIAETIADTQIDPTITADDHSATVPIGQLRTIMTPAPTTAPIPTATPLDIARLAVPGGEATLVEQLQFIARAQDGAAELKLHPAHLGALDVRITVEDNVARIHFASANASVREALEASVPRLREALLQDGVNLGQVSVSDQAPQERRDTAATPSIPWSVDEGLMSEPDAPAPDVTAPRWTGATQTLDLFA